MFPNNGSWLPTSHQRLASIAKSWRVFGVTNFVWMTPNCGRSVLYNLDCTKRARRALKVAWLVTVAYMKDTLNCMPQKANMLIYQSAQMEASCMENIRMSEWRGLTRERKQGRGNGKMGKGCLPEGMGKEEKWKRRNGRGKRRKWNESERLKMINVYSNLRKWGKIFWFIRFYYPMLCS